MDAQENLAVILDHVGDGVTVQDSSGRLVYANAAAARALGFASPADLLAASLSELADRFSLLDKTGEPFPREQLPGRRVLAGEAEAATTVRFISHATGEERWSVVRSSAVRDPSGRVLFAVNVWQDATAQMRAAEAQGFLVDAGEALATSLDVEATLANIAELSVPRLADWCAVHLVRDDGSVSRIAVAHSDPERVAWALRLQERYPDDPNRDEGITRVVRSGRPELYPDITDDMLVAGARDAEHLDILRRVGLSAAIIMPMLVRDRTVGVISFIAESGRRFDESDLALAAELARRAALAVDNARLYDAERAAREQAQEAQDRFRALFAGVPDAILVLDRRGRISDANQAACDLLGYDLPEMLETALERLAPTHAGTAALAGPFDPRDEWRGESELRRKDGQLVPVEIWARRLDLATGPIVIWLIRDISERIVADQAREEVLTAISHDLRNPLGSIKLRAQTLRRAIERGQAPDLGRLDEGLAAIDAMSSRIASLLEDIVEIARTRGSEGPPFSPEPADLVALAARCVDEAGAASDRDLRVAADVPTLVGLWDAQSIERVVLNLLNNALKYSIAGEVTVHIERIADEQGAHWASLTIQDRGIGIPASDLPRIFERYRRGRNVGQVAGTGLGLTGAKQIIERHGGAIAVASEEGRGTRVTIRLPLEPAPLPEAPLPG